MQAVTATNSQSRFPSLNEGLGTVHKTMVVVKEEATGWLASPSYAPEQEKD